MGFVHDTFWVTRVLVKNIHCASCISYVEDVLSSFGPAVRDVNISILSQMIIVQHRRSLPAYRLCDALTRAAFDVVAASTQDEQSRAVEQLEFKQDEGLLEVMLERYISPKGTQGPFRDLCVPSPGPDRRAHHLDNCQTCRAEEISEVKPARVLGNPQHILGGSTTKLSQDERCERGTAQYPTTDSTFNVQDSEESKHHHSRTTTAREPESVQTQHLLTVTIGGMTCASCANGITTALKDVDYITKCEVSLLTNSAAIEYTGSEAKAEEIVQAIEDVGFDASIATLKRLLLPTTNKFINHSEPMSERGRRSIELKIDGMFCKHCPARVNKALATKFKDLVDIEYSASLERPTIKLNYTPVPGSINIKTIVCAIDQVHEQFSTRVYHQPSVEDRSKTMQAQEKRKLLWRLLLCSFAIVPTFLIGVVWMSLVPATNVVHQYLAKQAWAGTVTRTEWALFILATPIMFLAADVFHLRAIKEVRALWRPMSRVPILRRFYRFGSMNLLISAGTSVAYFSSLALLIQGATSKSTFSANHATYFDSVVFLTSFILLGKWLEAYSKAKTGNAIAMLGKLRPQEAILVDQGTNSDMSRSSDSFDRGSAPNGSEKSSWPTQRVSVDLLEIGDVVLVPSGSSPPADGIIVTGSSRFNESSLTGEAREVGKGEGDQVFTGTINSGDPVQVQVTSLDGTSMLDKIITVVREGQSKRAPVERTVDSVTAYFVPVITALAITTFVVWFALGQSGILSPRYLDNQQGGWGFWSLEFAIAVFVVACPCGIGLAAPTALFVGGGLAAKNGILVRGGGEAFQEASKVDAVVFDKTGTLTEGGNPTVTDHEIMADTLDANLVWSITRRLEETSSHPLARALLRLSSAYPGVDLAAESIAEEPGRGLRGTFTVSTTQTRYEAVLGSEAFINSLQPGIFTYFHTNTLSLWKSQCKSVALLATRELSSSSPAKPVEESDLWTITAIFAVTDPIRPSAGPTIAALQARNISVYMLTGDNPATASAVASTLNIPADHVFAGVLPTEKADKIRWLQENGIVRSEVSSSPSWFSKGFRRKSNETTTREAIVAFIGDGINDAPALTTAKVSITLANSNDVALHSSSFILLGNLASASPDNKNTDTSLTSLLTLFDLSKYVFRRIKFNFAWAMVYNAILVPIAAGVLFRVRAEGWRLGPAWGSAAMAGSSISVVLSSVSMGWTWSPKGRRRWWPE
ncbi:MAG: hypothetical protein LQ352_003158 [Teloschistes flavicans]|nr:MAG: hypothetical protein LQ352_003158 [Teloschistes flavicans]